MTLVLLTVPALLLAWMNGANDNGKGVASLACSGELTLRAALLLAAAATLAGGIGAILGGEALATLFSGKGLVSDATAARPAFAGAAGIGALLTVACATWLRQPVSTSHALLGGLLGAGAAAGVPIAAGALVASFVLPLALSPLAAAGLGFVAAHAGTRALPRRGRSLHLLAASSTSFARGFQDTPKIAALLFLATDLPRGGATALVALAMTGGGLLWGARVGRRVSTEFCGCQPAHGLGASLVAASLVLAATPLGLPVSTTHVTCGSVAGAGLAGGRLDRRLLAAFAGAWLLTLPVAASLAAAASFLIAGMA